MGSIGVVCSSCSSWSHIFCIYHLGEGRVAHELSEHKEGEIVVPSRMTKENLEAYFKSIERTRSSEATP